MQKTWIVAADSSRARIFEVEGAGKNFREIQDFVNEAARQRRQDIRTEPKGRFYGKGEREQGHTAEANVDSPDHETELFAKAVCEYLDKGRVDHKYDHLFVTAYSKFLGLIREKLSKETQQLITREMTKDISSSDEREIAEFYINNRVPS